jgi:hypothetical protein
MQNEQKFKQIDRHTKQTCVTTPPLKMLKQTILLHKMGSKNFTRASEQISFL